MVAAYSGPDLQTPATGPRPLLLLYADTGGGHRASALAVAAAVAARHGDRYRCVLSRPFDELAPALVGRAVNAYAPVIRHAPWAWGAAWWATDSRLAVRALHSGFLRLVEPGLRGLVAGVEPAAVVSFHPLLNHVSARVVAGLPSSAGAARPPVITVVTDLVDIHASWTCAAVDAVVTPSPGGLDHCRRAGIAADRCFDLGLPVGAGFTSTGLDPATRTLLRTRLGLAPDVFTVLLSGGGEGSGGLLRRVRMLLEERLDIQLVVVCGRNAALRGQLAALRPAAPTRLRVEGFVENMPDFLRSADLAVTKAGPATIAEALCTGTPLLLTSYVPGQERGNVGFVVATGTGRWVPGLRQLVDAVRELSVPGAPALAAMHEALVHAARPAATARIADLVCALADRGAAA